MTQQHLINFYNELYAPTEFHVVVLAESETYEWTSLESPIDAQAIECRKERVTGYHRLSIGHWRTGKRGERGKVFAYPRGR